MSAEVAVPAALPAELDGGANQVVDAPDDVGGDFSTDELEGLRAKAAKMLHGGRSSDDDDDEAPAPPKPKPKTEAKPEPKPEPKKPAAAKPAAEDDEDADDPEDESEHRTKLSKDGKLDDEKLSNSFAALRRKNRALQASRAAFDADRAKYESERQGYQAAQETFKREQAEWTERRTRASREPLTALKELGWTWEQLTQYVANNGAVPPEKLIADTQHHQTEAESRYKSELEELKKQTQQFQDQLHAERYQQRVTSELRSGIDSGQYPLLKKYLEAKRFTFDAVVTRSLENVANVWKNEKRHVDVPSMLAYYERDLAEARKLHSDEEPGQARETPEAAKPVTNEATSERSHRRVDDDDGVWTEADAEAARKKARGILKGRIPAE